MAEILKEWLTERLQQQIKWEVEEFGEMMKNGHIIARVLLSYKVINAESFFSIKLSNNPDDIKNNWRFLHDWLRQVGIELSDNEKENVMVGKGSSLLRLFYQLFLHLDKRDRTNFIKEERKMVSKLVEKVSNRFKVDKVAEERETFIDLSKPLLNERQFIEWQKKKSEEVKDTYDYNRYKYTRMLNNIQENEIPLKWPVREYTNPPSKNLQQKMEEFAKRYPCNFENYSYEDLVKMETKAAERKKCLIDSEWAQNYMENLYSKMSKKSESEEFQKQIRNNLSGSLWDQSIAEEETRLDTELAKKVMKLSQFEKQMCTQLMETKQQSRNLVTNRIEAEKQYAEQREQQFNQYLDNVKEQINLGIFEIDFERRRQNMLHKKLYAEKIKRKRQHYHEICYETILALVDYATKYAYYLRLLGDEIPDHFIHEWKTLFFKRQPVFDILEPMEDILKEPGIEEQPILEEEEVIRLELIRQETLNDNDFLEYHNYVGPWNLELLIPNYDNESEERKYEYLGTRILGHVVHTLLKIKYPYPPPRPPAALPKFNSKALLRNLPDRSITVAMQTLLNYQKIHVVRLEAAINFCLRTFKNEMTGCTDIDLSFDKFLAVAQEELDKDLIKNLKIEDEILTKSSDTPSIVLGPLAANVKQTQTPKTIPEEEIVLSTSAELGRYAYELLSYGHSLTDHLISAMIVEYLKEQNGLNGFVLINYPNTYREAQVLEETFSGIEPPDEADLDDRDDVYLEKSISEHRKKVKDQYKEIRISKLVNDPHRKRCNKTFESYFTCYLKLIETQDILQELVVWDLTEVNSDFIDRFYAALGINYSMYYDMIEKDFLAQICKYIIGDLFPAKSTDRLFGENVLSVLEFPSTDDKRTKSKIVKPELSTVKSKDKMRYPSKTNKSDILQVPKPLNSELNMKDENTILMETEDLSKSSNTSISYEETKLLAGEEEWDYGDLPIAEAIGIALASCWEETEKSYITDLKQLVFAVRLQMNGLIPYTRFIKDKMDQIIKLPSQKQDLVNSFQTQYNKYEDDWRNVNLSKNEWHCRVKELQNRLYSICDERKLFAEQQRLALIAENWTMEELTSLVNTYISCMQTELNRSILTYQALHDFYYAMIKRMPQNDRLVSKELSKICRESENDLSGGSRKVGEDKLFKQLKSSFLELQLKNIEIDYSNNPFNMILENNAKFAIKVIKDTNETYRSLISREYSEIAKAVPLTKKKEDNTSEGSINFEEMFKQNALKCVEEWTMGINGEMFRACQRILALQYKCYHDMKLFNDLIFKTFQEIQGSINNYYINEVKAVDRLCKYLQMLIEIGKKIPETLILRDDVLVIDPNLLQFQKAEYSTTSNEHAEFADELQFKISQLARLKSQFKIVASTGIILQQAFIYLLQDFVIYGKESCDGPLVPELWKRIDPEQIPKLVFLLFGETVYVDWRDFLILCLNIPFPTVNVLLDLRKIFRCMDLESTELISRNNFLKQTFWFENNFDFEEKNSELRKNLIKHFLFELYETSEDSMNYSAFLLAFCKAQDPVQGFATALSMAVGKEICLEKEHCEEVILKLIKLKKYKDECLACAHKCAEKFLNTLLSKVVNTCEGTTITELEYTQSTADLNKKGKKGKGAKTKKLEIVQSARIPKIKPSAENNKMTQSAIDVKITYICRPCAEEEEEIAKEKPAEVVIEKPKISSPQENPDLAYAVSQAVIWNVLRICLPWHFVILPSDHVPNPYVSQVKEAIRDLENDTKSGDIYVFKFVSNPKVCKIFNKVRKFTALNLVTELSKVFSCCYD